MEGDLADDAVRRAVRVPVNPAFGMEALDAMGIDIDQDPRAFAKFLELKNLMRTRSARRTSLKAARRR